MTPENPYPILAPFWYLFLSLNVQRNWSKTIHFKVTAFISRGKRLFNNSFGAKERDSTQEEH